MRLVNLRGERNTVRPPATLRFPKARESPRPPGDRRRWRTRGRATAMRRRTNRNRLPAYPNSKYQGPPRERRYGRVGGNKSRVGGNKSRIGGNKSRIGGNKWRMAG